MYALLGSAGEYTRSRCRMNRTTECAGCSCKSSTSSLWLSPSSPAKAHPGLNEKLIRKNLRAKNEHTNEN